jgi:Fic family protein
VGRERVHHEAPPARLVEREMMAFLDWFNREQGLDPVTLATVLHKADFRRARAAEDFNPRQRDMLNRLLDGFTGKLTTGKWAKIEKCSPDTALRDINDLVERRILQKDPAGGRSTSYSLIE